MKTNLTLIKQERSRKQQRQFFIYILGIPLMAIGGWKIYRQAYWIGSLLIVSGIALVSLQIYANKAAEKLFRGWMQFAKILGTVNTWLLLSLIYLLVFIPLGLLKRSFQQKVPEEEAFKKQQSSWIPIDASTYGKERYHRAF